MIKKVLTFSIAAYNVEGYIEKCVGSMISPKLLDDIEVLIIDDGSSDATAKKALEYEKKYPGTVRLISKENGGHGSTINTGIKEARGRYFRAVDGDDWIDTKGAEKLVERLKKTDCDVVLCNSVHVFKNGFIRKVKYDNVVEKTYSMDEIATVIEWMNYHSVIYKTDILKNNNIHLDEHCFYVDTEFMAFPVPFIKTVAYYNLEIYCYRRDNEGQSISESSRMKNIEHSKKVAIRLLRFLKDNKKNLSPMSLRYLQRGVAGHCMWHFRSLTFFAPDKQRGKELISFDRYIKKMSPEVYRIMLTPASNRNPDDAKLIRLFRLADNRIFVSYGICRKVKHAIKNTAKLIAGKTLKTW